ncbi:MAG: HupE/UreJ family protein [Myxococcaceae bacterium]
MRPFLIVLVLLIPLRAFAHDADIVYAQLERTKGSSDVTEVITMTQATLQLLAPADSNEDNFVSQEELDKGADAIRAGIWSSLPLLANNKPCELRETQAHIKEGYLELRARFSCGAGPLSQTFRILSVLPRNYRVVLGSFIDGEAGQRFAQGNEQTLIIEPPAEGEKVSGLFGWISLGVRHIFGGPDHLAFLFALLLTATSLRRVMLMVTAFTIAHSITLGVTALGYLALSPGWARAVEVAIAVSIIFVAVENLVIKQEKHRPLIAFTFGLIHGFGFAASLKGYGIDREAVSALFGFNFGVELGQAAIVLLTVPLLRLLQKRPSVWRWFPKVASVGIAAAGGYWFVDRLLG